TSTNRGDDISRELEAMSSQADVESELAALKAGQQPASPQAIEGADDAGRIVAHETEQQRESGA
ncbi:MAG: PspA/IM30 family protein, partial [Marmoricola sp.]